MSNPRNLSSDNGNSVTRSNTVRFHRVDYESLNKRERENYNFQKVSGIMADYGFSTIRLSSDWQGADFIAQHCDGTTFLRVQLKGRPVFYKKYQSKDLWICYPVKNGLFLYPHDMILECVLGLGHFSHTRAWRVNGGWSFRKAPQWLGDLLAPYYLPAVSSLPSEALRELADSFDKQNS